VPTERSIPEVMMTKVQAMASTPLTAVACRMPTMLSVCMKAGEAKLKKIMRPIRLAKASSFCRADELNNTLAGACVSLVMEVVVEDMA
jgi:hypothetical protein